MNFLKKLFRHGLAGLAGAVLATFIGIVLLAYQFGRGFINQSYDLLFALRPLVKPQEIVLVYLDDDSHDSLNQPYTAPWDRSFHTRLLKRLVADQAKAVVFDVLFSDESNKSVDQAFAEAIQAHGKVILAADLVTGDQRVNAVRVELPLESLLQHAANVGVSEMGPDYDFIVRKHFGGRADMPVSSLSWAAAELVAADITKDEKEKYRERWINYYGPPRFLPHVSLYRAIAEGPEAPPAGFFRDQVVFVGASILTYMSGERKDEYGTPFGFWTTKEKSFMPGVEIHATEFLNLIRSDWLTRLPKGQEITLVIFCGLLFGFGLAQLRPFFAAFVASVGVGVILALSYLLFLHTRHWFAWTVVVGAQIPAALLWSVVFNSVNLYVQKRLMEHSLAMYVSPSRVKQIAKRPEMLKPGAEKQELSILFSDIANFTSMSEGMDSDELAQMMNNYFEAAVSNCIHKTEGTVVKFIGDAIFAIWNAPEPQPNHQQLACRGALLLRDQVTSFKFKENKQGLAVRTRIGLHCGIANVGNFGSSKRIDYTAIGENINLASRMEGLNKYLGTDLLITGDINRSVQGKFVTRFAGRFRLKGFEKAVDVYELLASAEESERTKAWREAFAEALNKFCKGNFAAAEAGFQCVLEMQEGDGPAKFYLKQIAELRAEPPDEGWTGEIELKEK